jgi:Xaa-Pro dipeptidase
LHEGDRLQALLAAEKKAEVFFAAIEETGLIAPGRTERMVEEDIYDLAERFFGVTRHWHRRIVRAGMNMLCISNEHPPVREIAEDDCVFIDLGPVFGEWEADVGPTYVFGGDPVKRKLPADLSRGLDAIKGFFDRRPDVTGRRALRFCSALGGCRRLGVRWRDCGPFPRRVSHARIPGDKDLYRISVANTSRMRDPDAAGQTRYWILEVHLVDRAQTFGGFYERLLVPR